MLKRKTMVIEEEDIKKIKHFNDVMQHGYYTNGSEVTALYNKVTGEKLSSTNCSSCIRHRISRMVNVLRAYEAELQAAEDERQKEQEQVVKEAEQPKKRGRRKKNESK